MEVDKKQTIDVEKTEEDKLDVLLSKMTLEQRVEFTNNVVSGLLEIVFNPKTNNDV